MAKHLNHDAHQAQYGPLIYALQTTLRFNTPCFSSYQSRSNIVFDL